MGLRHRAGSGGLIAVALIAAALWLMPAQPAAAGLPWQPGDAAPAVAGVHLGDERATVEKLLGEAPEHNELDNGALGLIYPERGLAFVLNTRGGGVALMYLLAPAAGALDGIACGSPREAVLARWGEPTLVQGAQAFYVVGKWSITLQLGADQQVAMLSVGRAGGELEALQP